MCVYVCVCVCMCVCVCVFICVLENLLTTSVQIMGHCLPEMSILNMMLDLVTGVSLINVQNHVSISHYNPL
jgi:hypothetical protein